MVEMCQQKAYGGGVVLETSLYGTRVIPEWNIDPPKHPPLGIETGDKVGETYSHINNLLKNGRGALLENPSPLDGGVYSTFKTSRL
jgi:hypothetical protein